MTYFSRKVNCFKCMDKKVMGAAFNPDIFLSPNYNKKKATCITEILKFPVLMTSWKS